MDFKVVFCMYTVSDKFTCDKFTCDKFTCDKFTCDEFTCDEFTCDEFTCDEYTCKQLHLFLNFPAVTSTTVTLILLW